MSRAPLFVEAEVRSDRGVYDEETPSHLFLPNGTIVASFHRGFLGAAARYVLDLWRAEQ